MIAWDPLFPTPLIAVNALVMDTVNESKDPQAIHAEEDFIKKNIKKK